MLPGRPSDARAAPNARTEGNGDANDEEVFIRFAVEDKKYRDLLRGLNKRGQARLSGLERPESKLRL